MLCPKWILDVGWRMIATQTLVTPSVLFLMDGSFSRFEFLFAAYDQRILCQLARLLACKFALVGTWFTQRGVDVCGNR